MRYYDPSHCTCGPCPTTVTQASNLCLNSIVSVFRADETGVPSLEVVRLLNRMTKERRFNVHSNVLTCLLHLRLKTELGVRASEAKVEREEVKREREKVKQGKKSKGQGAVSTHLSKKAKKALKERKEIEKEMKEAEASVGKEERAANVSRDSFPGPRIETHFTDAARTRSKPKH